jgi:lysophospholipase L1-like esterase
MPTSEELLFSAPSLVRKPGLLVPLLLVSTALIQAAVFWRGVQRARSLAAQARRYERRLASKGLSILILGDSTGVGVGANLPEESIAGLLAADFPDADIVNISESGARVTHAIAQAKRCNDANLHFDLAILHLGGNDIVQATPIDKLSESCETLMVALQSLAPRAVWLGPPNLGIAPLFPPPYSWVLAARSRAAAAVFAQCAARHNVSFIDFSAPAHAQHFKGRRGKHFAIDGFHPNSSSYKYGYAAARQVMGLAPKR